MDSIIRKYLRNRVMRMRKMMRDAKESGRLYYAYEDVTVRRGLYYFHKMSLMECHIVFNDKRFSSVMMLMFLRFLHKETNVPVTQRMVDIISRTKGNPYFAADVIFYEAFHNGNETAPKRWKMALIKLLESENMRMRKRNKVAKFFGMGRQIVKPAIEI